MVVTKSAITGHVQSAPGQAGTEFVAVLTTGPKTIKAAPGSE